MSNKIKKQEKGLEMASKVSQCNICNTILDSKKKLREHKDRTHRITDSKIAAEITKLAVLTSFVKVQKVYSANEKVL